MPVMHKSQAGSRWKWTRRRRRSWVVGELTMDGSDVLKCIVLAKSSQEMEDITSVSHVDAMRE